MSDGPRWKQDGHNYSIVKCDSCGLTGTILQGSGGKGWKNVGGRFFCEKSPCLEASKMMPVQTPIAVPFEQGS